MSFLIVALTLFAPVIMLPINVLGYVNCKRSAAAYIFGIALAMAALAYNYAPLPLENADLIRHYDHMQIAQNMSLAEAAQNELFGTLLGYFLLLKLFSFAEVGSLLPAAVTFVGYFLCLYVLSKMDDGKNTSIRALALFLFMSCIPLFGFCSGIRQCLVFAVFTFVFYLEAVLNRFRIGAWIVYLLLITMHTSVSIIIALRLICVILNKSKRLPLLCSLVFLWSFAQNSIMSFLEGTFASNKYVNEILELFGYYEEHASNIVWPNFLWRAALLALCMFVVIRLLSEKDNCRGVAPRKYLCFCMVLCAFAFGSVMHYDIFVRFCLLVFMMVLPLFPAYFSRLGKDFGLLLYGGTILAGACVLLYNTTQHLSSNWNGIMEILTTNFFTFLVSI